MSRTLEAIRERIRAKHAKKEAVVKEPAMEPSYRDLQAQAKALDIPANQSADDLKAAIEEAPVAEDTPEPAGEQEASPVQDEEEEVEPA
jgi:hypothetical protein